MFENPATGRFPVTTATRRLQMYDPLVTNVLEKAKDFLDMIHECGVAMSPHEDIYANENFNTSKLYFERAIEELEKTL